LKPACSLLYRTAHKNTTNLSNVRANFFAVARVAASLLLSPELAGRAEGPAAGVAVSIVGTTVEEVHCDGAHFRRDIAAKAR